MNHKMIIRLPGNGRLAVYLLLLWVMVMLWLRDVLGLPSAISYLTDVLVLYAFVTRINKILYEAAHPNLKVQNRIFVLILAAILFGTIINLVNPLLILWAARNNLRFFLFFYICVGLLTAEDIDRILSMIVWLFWANVLVCAIQYFGQGLSGDYLGGLFGTARGCNAYMNILLCIVTSMMFSRYFAGKTSLFKLIVYAVICMYIAILAELKAFYVEFVMIMAVSMFLSGISWKLVLACVFGALGIYVWLLVLAWYNMSNLRMLFDMDILELYLMGNGYTGRGDLNRFTAFRQIYDRFFDQNFFRALFGFGFGNCEWSQFPIFQSSFARQYSHIHYRWFTHAWVFLEQGIVGVILLLMFFLSIFGFSVKRKKQIRPELSVMTACFVCTSILGIIYNCALQLESCYMIAFACAIPYIDSKRLRRSNSINPGNPQDNIQTRRGEKKSYD